VEQWKAAEVFGSRELMGAVLDIYCHDAAGTEEVQAKTAPSGFCSWPYDTHVLPHQKPLSTRELSDLRKKGYRSQLLSS
jgi:hypothetical protein